MPDEDATRVAIAAEQVRTIADKVIAAGTTFNKTQAHLDNVSVGFSNMSTNFATLSAKITQFGETVRVDLMARLDRLQDEQTKQRQRLDMEVLIQLVRDTAQAELLARIRQLEDEIRELKEEKDRPSPAAG